MRSQRGDDSFRAFASRALLKRLAALTKEIGGVRRADDAEHVHRMRVASRRLRSAIDVFAPCFPARAVRRWNRRMRSLRRALGEARDTDVRLAYLGGLLSDLKDSKTRCGVERLVLRLNQRREAEQENVLKALAGLEESRPILEMREALQAAAPAGAAARARAPSPQLYQEAVRSIVPRIDALLSYDPFVRHPQRVAEHHQMRIAAKQLRYTVEVFEPLYGGSLGGVLDALRSTQDMLGEIHDCDVWVDWLPVFVQQERERTIRYFGSGQAMRRLIPGLEFVRENRRERRRQSHTEFAAYWESLRGDGVFDALRAVVQEGSAPDSSPSEPAG